MSKSYRVLKRYAYKTENTTCWLNGKDGVMAKVKPGDEMNHYMNTFQR